jgi:serine/threonine-protein kinase HipA
MKLAMAIGDARHYPIDSVMPRHFIQTAAKAGIGPKPVTAIFDELRHRALAAIELVCASLPKGFPSQVADAIGNGVKARVRRLEEV